MFTRFLIAAVFLLAACQSAAPTETPVPLTATPLPPTQTPIPPTATTSGWLETEMNGVSLGMWRPDGWETDLNQGLVLAEQTVSPGGMVEGGMLIHCFVPSADEFQITSGDADFALAVLNQVVKMPIHTGRDVAMTEPVGFQWDQQQAAYYLFTTGDGVRALVLALALPGQPRVVVCTISIPAAQSNRIRAALPQLLDGLAVDGKSLDGSALDTLPDPLPFPRYRMASSSGDNRMTLSSPP